MKYTVTFVFIVALVNLVSCRPTFDKIAEVLLDAVLTDTPNSRYPPGSGAYQQGYHQHHHDHHYYGNSVQPGGYYQHPNGGYSGSQLNYYPSQATYAHAPPYAQGPYSHHPYPYSQGPHSNGNYGSYPNPGAAFSMGASVEYQPSEYERHRSYKTQGY
ncbi:uncharacterized histidine-rich protein DDB_G0274557-like [Rhagoletis pomonella]|uniref:uncharacterized histidine-rich protein DDB_G0274557-like n=1 Tax=Rhagoletis pomonella TaxID=28610 RepID=UPI0017816650|nr:uncharacterized histidine-rich protein DDB_G0274557-like [Rhagoletis pomonella]